MEAAMWVGVTVAGERKLMPDKRIIKTKNNHNPKITRQQTVQEISPIISKRREKLKHNRTN